jgi:hypothetical protein
VRPAPARLALLALAVATAFVAAGCGGAGQAAGGSGGRHRAAASPAGAGHPSSLPVVPAVVRGPDQPDEGPPGPAAASAAGAPQPTRVRIPRIGVDSGLATLGLNGDGTIQAPSDPNQAGWYARGPAPGDPGPAVILGHLDSTTGPAVFARLASLRAGDQVLVARADGSMATFTVQRLATVPVDAFPTQDVYGVTPEPALRLITCGGTFSLAEHRYQSNVVVFAGLSGMQPG